VWDRFVEGAPRQTIRRILDTLAAEVSNSFRWTSAWPAVGVGALVLIGHPIQWPTDFPEFRFPTKIVERHRERLLSERVMTMDQWADYLIYRLYPGVKVYFDGRSDFYGPKIGKEYRQLITGEYNWREIISRNRFTVALVPPDWALTSLLKQDPSWRLLEDDGKALLFVLDSPDTTGRAEQDPDGTGKKGFTGLMKIARASESPIGADLPMKREHSLLEKAGKSSLRAANDSPEESKGGWRLPSGLLMVDFALRGGFIAPGLLPGADSPVSFSWKPNPPVRAVSRKTQEQIETERSLSGLEASR
jgi:hypothetical protein